MKGMKMKIAIGSDFAISLLGFSFVCIVRVWLSWGLFVHCIDLRLSVDNVRPFTSCHSILRALSYLRDGCNLSFRRARCLLY